jgi:hypothetical protein
VSENSYWDRIILDAAPPVLDLGGLAVGDVDGDGQQEIVVAGNGALLWYRPGTTERGTIAEGRFVVGLALEDVDGDDQLEVFAGQGVPAQGDPEATVWEIAWFDPGPTLDAPWSRHVIATQCSGSAHDILFCDVDGDGQREMVANAAYCAVPGVFIYKPGQDLGALWAEHTVVSGIFSEGLSTGDLSGDSRVEIVHGPDWYVAPDAGPYAGTWTRQVYAHAFREMCRTALVDVTGNGRLDIVIAESEYPDGRMAWFENALAEGKGWIEHPIEAGSWPLDFAHSLQAWNDADGRPHVFVAEMAAGGWNQPYNWDARLLEFVSSDGGATWQVQEIEHGQGTHQATMVDLNGDGQREVAGKEWGSARAIPRVHLWVKRAGERPFPFAHVLIDRDKPQPGTDIFAADVDGDGLQDIFCARWWYQNPGRVGPAWRRRQIPGVAQLLSAYDLDGDGRMELIATKLTGEPTQRFSNAFCWLKAVDPLHDAWEMHDIGVGDGDWPHGTILAPLLPGDKLALVAGYHSAHANPDRHDLPQLFALPADPAQPWPKRTLVDVAYGEEFVTCDLNGNGLLDLIAGAWWLENLGDGSFRPHHLADVESVARVRAADVNGNGLQDVIYVVEDVDYRARVAGWVDVAWLENPGDPARTPWRRHVIDKVRSPHSVDLADLDGDGQLEIVVGEHDPFTPYRSRSRLLVYKKADPDGLTWRQYVLDSRFEHHDGAKVVEIWPGRLGIVSHGWADNRYVHLWVAPQKQP